MPYPIAVPAADHLVRLPIALLLLSACAERRAPPGDSLAATTSLSTRLELEPDTESLRASTAGWQGSPDTLAWADSTARGDTTFYGKGRLVTNSQVLVDSQWIQVAAPPAGTGIPVGLLGLWRGTQLLDNSEIFTLSYGTENPGSLVQRIEISRARGMKMVTAMTGGARANYLSDGVFDMEKWKARMDRFNTPRIRDAVAQAVSEGILIGNSVMDEPFNDGGPGNERNSWGPKGTMSKARVDSMCAYVKEIFPTLPQGVFQDYRLEPTGSYRVCDFITSQYRVSKGSITEYRDGALELCRRDKHACSFAINVLDGGIPVKKLPGQKDFVEGDCPLTTTGGPGTY
ncbi:MAG TPA: hypothetical protein VFZ87_02860, partial [Gemmatimonadales bacterium]